MSIQTRLVLVAGLPGGVALSLIYLAAIAQAPGDGHRLVWYAMLIAAVGSVWGLYSWGMYWTRLRAELHDDEIADLRCGHRRLERELKVVTDDLASLTLDRAVGYPGVPEPARRLHVVRDDVS